MLAGAARYAIALNNAQDLRFIPSLNRNDTVIRPLCEIYPSGFKCRGPAQPEVGALRPIVVIAISTNLNKALARKR
jgi:hypothetical protein